MPYRYESYEMIKNDMKIISGLGLCSDKSLLKLIKLWMGNDGNFT